MAWSASEHPLVLHPPVNHTHNNSSDLKPGGLVSLTHQPVPVHNDNSSDHPHPAFATSHSVPPFNMPPPTSTVPQSVSRKRKLASMADVSPSVSPSTSPLSVHDNDSEYDPSSQPVASSSRSSRPAVSSSASTSKRGPRPSVAAAVTVPTSSKGRPMSREALRKANHSLIERRRREKINFALGELRDMVPGLGDEGSGKAGEFKLEVLERTVIHMRYLQDRVNELEKILQSQPSSGAERKRRKEGESIVDQGHRNNDVQHTTSTSPPSPSMSPPESLSRKLYPQHQNLVSPDPNETETESNLPPPFTHAGWSKSDSRRATTGSPGRPSAQSNLSSHSIGSLLGPADNNQRNHQPPVRPPAPPQANNPTLYLPFPTPSPTSPFLTYPSTLSSHTSSAATSIASSTSSGPPEPSPFLAPLPNIGLFGGALNFESMSPADAMGIGMAIPKQPTPPDLRIPSSSSVDKGSGMGAEEAANLLLAFSSPDTLRPTTGSTPLMSAMAGLKERRLTLDGEDFSLDGGVATSSGRMGIHSKGNKLVGKTARDILRM